jgi:hypothetical protein
VWKTNAFGIQNTEIYVMWILFTASGFSSDTDRIVAFEASGYGSWATFYRLKKRFGMV